MTHSSELAAQVGTALLGRGELDDLARSLLESLGELDSHVVYDVGQNVWLVVYPGWGPLQPPQDYVHLARPGP